MSFEARFKKLLSDDVDDVVLYKKGGHDYRHRNVKTGADRVHQNFIPVVHKASGEDNNAIEHLRNNGGTSHVCTPQDLIHIINTYIKQGDQEPCNINNVQQMAQKYLSTGKDLGTTGMRVMPRGQAYVIVK
jgi:hypothetical protein